MIDVLWGARGCICGALLLIAMQSAQASSDNSKAFAIAKQNACLGCHAVNKKIVGPSYRCEI